MPDIAAIVTRLGGLAQKQQLVTRGARDLDLTRAVRSREVVRVRNGWYSTWAESDPRLRAVRVGGRLTGISAVLAWEGWARDTDTLHVSVPANAARLRNQWNRHKRHQPHAPARVALHWEEPGLATRGTAATVGLSDALIRVVLDESLETSVACLDWALHTQQLDSIDFELLILALPDHLQYIADWVDADCESLPESLSRTRLRMSGHSVTSQVPVGEREAIDLVIDECIGLEVDGERWHVNRFERDRRKDITMTIARYHAIRPAAVHVFGEWELVERAIEVALEARGRPARGISGVSRASLRMFRAMAGPRGRRRRSTPEFPNTRARSGGARRE
jgi:very-short-patch-repair endonuclease